MNDDLHKENRWTRILTHLSIFYLPLIGPIVFYFAVADDQRTKNSAKQNIFHHLLLILNLVSYPILFVMLMMTYDFVYEDDLTELEIKIRTFSDIMLTVNPAITICLVLMPILATVFEFTRKGWNYPLLAYWLGSAKFVESNAQVEKQEVEEAVEVATKEDAKSKE